MHSVWMAWKAPRWMTPKAAALKAQPPSEHLPNKDCHLIQCACPGNWENYRITEQQHQQQQQQQHNDTTSLRGRCHSCSLSGWICCKQCGGSGAMPSFDPNDDDEQFDQGAPPMECIFCDGDGGCPCRSCTSETYAEALGATACSWQLALAPHYRSPAAGRHNRRIPSLVRHRRRMPSWAAYLTTPYCWAL